MIRDWPSKVFKIESSLDGLYESAMNGQPSKAWIRDNLPQN
jgi:hypothetical protein